MNALTWMLLAAGAVAAAGLASAARAAEPAPKDFPRTVLEKGGLKLTVYLPDAGEGFYRGARFDWSGLVARAEFGGRTVFGPFRLKYDATNHDNVVGPAEEFDMDQPQGYAEAAPGEAFVKIGVGLLTKPEEEKYGFMNPYTIASTGRWTFGCDEDWVEFKQVLGGPRGWGYEYTKRLTLAEAGPGFTIAHALANTGTKPIDTTVYCHNFVVLDDEPVGPNYRIEFPFDLKPREHRGKVEFKGRELVMPEVLTDSVWIAFTGAGFTPAQHTVTLTNRRTGTGVRIQGNRPVSEWRFYAEKTAACPEPFVRIRVPPGTEATWRTVYTLLAGAAKP